MQHCKSAETLIACVANASPIMISKTNCLRSKSYERSCRIFILRSYKIRSQVLQDTLHRVDLAFKALFRRVKNGEKPGYPRFQGRERFDSFTYSQAGFSRTHDNRITLSKIGSVKIKLHRLVQGKVKTCTIKREGEHWYVCLSCEVEACPRLPYIDDVIGIDLGVSKLATLSTGDVIENPRHYRKAEKKLNASR
ncbi:MAG TPA: transposase [Ktedonobacteraceae bacterium]|nr:transposase [Ktedonobacteraceae bacterium]